MNSLNEEGLNKFDSPWDFNPSYPNPIKADIVDAIQYSELREICQGGPLIGKCYWLTTSGNRILIEDKCAGPCSWSNDGIRVAIPIWVRGFIKTSQQIVVLNTQTSTISKYKRSFSVLKIQSFENNLISCIDDPLIKNTMVTFDLDNEVVEGEISLR